MDLSYDPFILVFNPELRHASNPPLRTNARRPPRAVIAFARSVASGPMTYTRAPPFVAAFTFIAAISSSTFLAFLTAPRVLDASGDTSTTAAFPRCFPRKSGEPSFLRASSERVSMRNARLSARNASSTANAFLSPAYPFVTRPRTKNVAGTAAATATSDAALSASTSACATRSANSGGRTASNPFTAPIAAAFTASVAAVAAPETAPAA
mmetsp:Transcript_109511/g.266210  ORF Transcript_109511/g.266210 Transcript_109511/m.266210 type:complete len:210 (+) Transcript_109511:538-1167(+)